jgi:hypothetical protein
VDLEIEPAPSEAEREAIAAALEALEAVRETGRSSWWQAGVQENLDGDEGG